jgi:hypothetical protein
MLVTKGERKNQRPTDGGDNNNTISADELEYLLIEREQM